MGGPFSDSGAATGDLLIMDSAGRLVRRLQTGTIPAGPHEVRWDGRDESGTTVTAGVYHALFRAPGRHESRKIVFLR